MFQRPSAPLTRIPLWSRSLLISFLLAGSTVALAQELPRRTHFGAMLAPAPGGGVQVEGVAGDGPAAKAGIKAGDRITGAGSVEPVDLQTFLALLARRRAGDILALRVEQGGEATTVDVRLEEAPRFTSDAYRVEYGAVEVDGALRRTIATIPDGEGPHPAILLVGGVGCYSLDASSEKAHPYLILRDTLTKAGYATLWVEKSGMGDSQGPPCPQIDFETELAGYRAGLRALQAHPAVVPERVFIFGHSMGGLLGPLLTAETDVAGVIAVSTSGLPWMEYMLANLRRQLPMEGMLPWQVDAAMREAIRANYAIFVEGRDPVDLLDDHPEWQPFLAFPQHVSYMRQVAEKDPAAVWRDVRTPVLLIAGGADFVADPGEHERLKTVLETAGSPSTKYVLIDDLDHFMNRVADARASFSLVQSGQPFRSFNEELARVVLDWLRSHAG